MTDTNDDNLISEDEKMPPPEGDLAPVDDYAEVETEVRSDEDTEAAEKRPPVEPSPGHEDPEPAPKSKKK